MGKQKRQAVLGVLITAALVLSFVAMMAAVVMVSLPVFAFAAAVSYLADLLLHTAESSTLDRLRDSRFGLTIRFLIRQFLLLALCGAIIDLDSFVIQMTAVGLLLLFTLQLVYGAMIKRVKSERAALPFTTRGLDLEALGIRRLPHPFLTSKHVRKMLHLDVPLVAGAIGTVATDDWQYVTFGGIATVWLAFLAVLVLLPGARNALILPTPDEALDELNWQLGQYRPQVALYFTFAAVSRDFMYQVNMWLESLEELDLRPIIVLRERATLRFLDATSVPVICVPKAEYLARVEMPELRVTLYPGNAGKNVHMLQRHEVKHVFIGHGDSDKLASSNRVSKVFDEIWVAGRAGRDRYERIKHAVTAHQIVEVGRPQLMPLRRWTGSVDNEIPTVIYAPTWEGWTDDACYTSVIPAGEHLIRTLLSYKEQLRIIYKPHPLTGTRSPAAAAAHRRIIALLQEDNTRRFGRKILDSKTAARRLARIDKRLAALQERGVRSKYPDLTEAERTTRIRKFRHQAGALYWDSLPVDAHHVVTDKVPTLYDCFNHSDLLIGDMSSVVSDFVATRKPYAIFNLEGLPDAEFRNEQRTAYASYLLDAECNGLETALTAMLSVDQDVMAPYREQLKEYLLGPDNPPSTVRFAEAANTLYRSGIRDFPVEHPDQPGFPEQQPRQPA
ncbi:MULTISPECIES: hypothetical protein [Streptomyces]|uniref:hypothetical protein n=1 Tax=Streptomyces TaxID=1883 RepID=UPI000306A94F|nr:MULTISPECIES: hypothetical protein [Streptomyces]MCX4487850.1 hypothetical protein [Streptomyces anulatus]MCX4501346.1 hypothetical protein [Streptomyces anulatus]MCX4522036.1 hypothetical protein [Streptomyces anulatus]MCX4604913.1 hypothetical protein [Streptomyces anulatus]OKI54062.1 hypothetical protein AMK17_23775 [Streptomyces sp. CB00072]